MEIQDKTVAELVSENYRTADVFKKYGIDFCCGGGKPISEACAAKNVDFNKIIKDLDALETTIDRQHDFNNWELDFLVDYILNLHHTYVKESIPVMLEYAAKVASVHGHHFTETVEINKLFTAVAEELMSHLNKEEQILFPYVKQMVAIKKEGKSMSLNAGIANPIRVMELEHENAGDIFKRIAGLSNNYTPPQEACNTYRVLYSKLEEFENDLHQHIHLENNILFPKAKKMELELIG